MHIVVIGDIGVVDDMIHIGDEAMFEQLRHELGSRGFDEIIALSANPADSAERYGIRAIPRIGFSGSRTDMAHRLRAVLSGELSDDDPAVAVISAIQSSAGVIIAGGGNLASVWPLHIFERSAIGAIADRAGVPLVVSGQTIGPHLIEEDVALVADLLSSARLVGVRESASERFGRTLGIVATLTIDDASYLPDDQPTGDYCLVTLAGHVGAHDRAAFVRQSAGLLDHVADSTGLEIVFSPHFGSVIPGDIRGDSVMHAAVAQQMRSPSREIAATDAATSGALARGAALVVSSRYHPVVFAVPGGVPAIGIAVDEYTTVKLTGALANFGQDSVLAAESLLEGGGPGLVDSVWSGRGGIRAPNRREEARQWWDRIAGSLK